MKEKERMSEEKKKKTPLEIQQEYTVLAARAGDLQYKVSRLTRDLNTLNDQIESLNFEFVTAQKAEAEKAKQTVPQQAETPANG